MIPYAGNQFPQEYQNTFFIAEHGSWNRDVGIGYRIMNVNVDQNTGATTAYNIFAEGWLQDPTAPSFNYTNWGAWGDCFLMLMR